MNFFPDTLDYMQVLMKTRRDSLEPHPIMSKESEKTYSAQSLHIVESGVCACLGSSPVLLVSNVPCLQIPRQTSLEAECRGAVYGPSPSLLLRFKRRT